jgi:hypothetical protein
MLRPILFSLLLSLPASISFAQKHKQEFQLAFPETKVSNSFYNRIQLLDVRDDTTNLGFVQTGNSNRKEILIANPALGKQLRIILGELVDSATAQSGELLLRLSHFRFSEITSTYSEIGYCHLGGELMVKREGGYQLLDTLNTLIKLEVDGQSPKPRDVTDPLLKAGINRINTFLAKNLTRAAGGRVYSDTDVQNLDSFMKRNLPVYNATTYTNGLYKTYDAFMAQKPDAQISAEVKGDKLRRIWQVTPEGEREQRPNPAKIYGLVVEGIPYIATEFGYYPMRKVKDDFVFEGKMRIGSNDAIMMTAGMFGLAGALIGMAVSPKVSDTYEMKIDFRTGQPVPVQKMD